MNRIKQLREDKQITQEELAKQLDLSKGIISLYEKEERKPSLDVITKMCEIFDCTMDYLMGKSDFKTNEEELDNYLDKEIKDNLVKILKELELDKSDLEKAITAFIENYMTVTDNPTVNIYNMEDSSIYYAYELITKYYFKLINKELSVLTNNSELLIDKQAYFEKAERNAWYKMKKILEDINNNTIISDLTSEEKAHKFISTLETTTKIYMCPVYGRISAGQPNWAEECIEGRIPIDPVLFDIVNPEEHFFLRVNR